MKKYDLLVIGFGKAGKTLAVHAKKQGMSVAVVEKDEAMFGGTCINVACIPTKNLKHLSQYLDYSTAIEDKNNFIAKLRAKNKAMIVDNGIDLIVGEAVFENENTVIVGGEKIVFEKAVINTGSKPVPLPVELVEKFNMDKVFYSDSIMQTTGGFEHLAIMGGGYIGLEMASIYANFGFKVSLFDKGQILSKEDEDVREVIKSELGKKVTVYENSTINSFDGKLLSYTLDGVEKTINADGLLVAISRMPNTDRLGLENAGIKVDEHGYVECDEFLQTSNPKVYAVGDVKKDYAFTYISLDDYRILADRFFGGNTRSRLNRGTVPYSLFIDPVYSHVGLSQKEAEEKNIPVRVARFMPANSPKANLVKKPEGYMKAIIHAETSKILGASLFVYQSEEIINLIKMAIDLGLEYKYFSNMIFTHPTISENLNDLFAEANIS